MTVERITPCVCCDHLPNEGDPQDYGMPVLIPSNGLKPFKQFWDVKCPKCGRGGMFQFKSAYLALRGWNDLMAESYLTEGKELPYAEELAQLFGGNCSGDAQIEEEPHLACEDPKGQHLTMSLLELGRKAVDLAISDNYENWSLNTEQAVKDALSYTTKPVIETVLSVAINKSLPSDVRYTKQNREWASQVHVENSLIMDAFKDCFHMSAHPGLINLFTDEFRKYIACNSTK